MFSKYDVYTTVQSMYCYPDTDVLINKLNIHDKAELKQAEEEFTAVKQMALLQEPIKGRFTKTHLFRIHRFLFEDVYPFAGHIRKEQISKGDTMFYPPDLIDRELERVFKTIHSKKLLAEQDKEKQLQADDILNCYDFFEWLIEQLFDVINSVFFRVTHIDEKLQISVHVMSSTDIHNFLKERPELLIQQEEEQEWFIRCPLS